MQPQEPAIDGISERLNPRVGLQGQISDQIGESPANRDPGVAFNGENVS